MQSLSTVASEEKSQDWSILDIDHEIDQRHSEKLSYVANDLEIFQNDDENKSNDHIRNVDMRSDQSHDMNEMYADGLIAVNAIQSELNQSDIETPSSLIDERNDRIISTVSTASKLSNVIESIENIAAINGPIDTNQFDSIRDDTVKIPPGSSQDVFQQLLRVSIDASLQSAEEVDEKIKQDTLTAINTGDVGSLDINQLIGEQ